MKPERKSWPVFIGCLLLPQLAGLVGALFTFEAVETWYRAIAKPSLTPPGWVFGPVWTVLYLLMGLSLYLVVCQPKPKRTSLLLFGTQLVFNSLWSVLFFGFRLFGAALGEIFVLWVLILFTTIHFWRLSRQAGRLLIPYLLWVSFAGYLNLSFWLINR